MDDLDSLTCGEILLLNSGNLIVCCTLCESTCYAFHEYAEHVTKNHRYLEVFESFVNDDRNLNSNRCSPTENEAPLVSEDDFKKLDELEFLAPEPQNCKEIEEFVITHKKQKQATKVRHKQPKNQARRVFKCEECGFATHYLSSMRAHIQRHDGIRKFKCLHCTKAFYTQSEVGNHMRTHTLERPYLCTTCGHTCVTSFALWRHRKSCNNIRDKECTICDAKFADLNALREHMSTHSNIREFHCDRCNASFKLKKALLSHKKIHENKRDYKCKLCPASFNQAPSLSSHMKNKH